MMIKLTQFDESQEKNGFRGASIRINAGCVGTIESVGGGKREDGKTEEPTRTVVYLTGFNRKYGVDVVESAEEVEELVNDALGSRIVLEVPEFVEDMDAVVEDLAPENQPAASATE